MTAASRKKNSPDESKRLFLERSWDVLWEYLGRLGETEVVNDTDSRGCASVVKTLLDSISRAEESMSEPEEDEEIAVPDIPEESIRRALEICFPESLPKAPAQKPRRDRAGVSDRQAAVPSP